MAQNNRNVNYNIKLSAKVDSSVKRLKKQIDDIEKKVNGVNGAGIKPKIDPKTKKGVDGLSKSFGGLTDNLKGALSNIPLIGGELAALSGPAGIAVAAIAAVGAVLVTTAQDIDKVDKSVKQFTKSIEETSAVTDSVRALQKTFQDLDQKELANATKTLVKEFGLSGEEAIKKLEQALIATNGQLDLDNIKEYSSQIKSLGGDADKLLTTLVVSEQEGFFQDKGIDTLKEFGLRIRELPKAAEDALKAVGVDVTKLEKDLNSGAKTQSQAFKDIFGDLSKFSTKQRQTLIADVLGGPGEDLGERGIEILANQNKSLDELTKKNAKIAKINETNKKLTEAQGKATRQLVPAIRKVEEIWTNIQTAFFEILTPIIDLGVEIGKLVDELGVFDIIGGAIFVTWELIKGTVTVIAKSLQFVVRIIRDLVQLIKVGVLAAFNKLREVIIDIFGEERIKRWKDNIITAFNFIRKIWENIANFISDTFEKLGNFAAGKGFVVDVKTEADPSAEANQGSTNQTGGGTGAGGESLDGKIAGALDTSVKSSIQGEVKTITVSIDKVQEIGVQHIGADDMESFKENLQIALTSVIADTSQL